MSLGAALFLGLCDDLLVGLNATCGADFQILQRQEATEATTSFTFTNGIEGAGDVELLYTGVIYTTVNNFEIVLKPNGLSSNMYSHGIIGEGSAFVKGTSGNSLNIIDTGVIAQPATIWFFGSLGTENGTIRTGLCLSGSRQNGTSTSTTDHSTQVSTHWWESTGTSLSSLEFEGTTNGIGAGSWITTYSQKATL
jgi:hypothetical protein